MATGPTTADDWERLAAFMGPARRAPLGRKGCRGEGRLAALVGLGGRN